MKNALDFNVQYNQLEGLNFIQRFATAYTFLETEKDATGNAHNPDIAGLCVGCFPGCKKDEAAAIRCRFFFLFNTVTGNSAVRCRFDGHPTEMQRLIGDTDEEGHGCGSDFVADFLFGYAGYDYRKCTDPAMFKEAIIAAIDAGRPVIARAKTESPRFYLISGYDGDALICPEFTRMSWDFEQNKLRGEGPDGPSGYDALDALYIFGGRIARRYTLRDGLENIRRALACNIRESVLNGYLAKLGGWGKYSTDDGFDAIGPEERAARALRLHETVMYIYNICSLDGAFGNDGKARGHYLHAEQWNPALIELWKNMEEPCRAILESGHKFGGFRRRDWAALDPSELPGVSAGICRAVERVMEADRKLLAIINRAIEILDRERHENG